MEATAIYDFRASLEDELSFRPGEILKILQFDEVIEVTIRFYLVCS